MTCAVAGRSSTWKSHEPSAASFAASTKWANGTATSSSRARPGSSCQTSARSNQVPARVVVPTFEELCGLLGTSDDVRALGEPVPEAGGPAPAT